MTKSTTLAKKNKKTKVEKGEENSKVLPSLSEIISEENLDALIKIINESIPREKIMATANKIIGEIVYANREPEITKTYTIIDEGIENTAIRSVRYEEDGCFKKCTLEKYNPKLDTWEPYERPIKTVKDLAKEVDEIEWGVKCVSFDLEAISKMLGNLIKDGSIDKDDFDSLYFIERTLKDNADKLYKEGEKLELMDFDFNRL